MIIPIRCFTCGKVIAHLWETYLEKLQIKYNSKEFKINVVETKNINNDMKTPEAEILDELGINRYCCRRMILAHIDLCDRITKN